MKLSGFRAAMALAVAGGAMGAGGCTNHAATADGAAADAAPDAGYDARLDAILDAVLDGEGADSPLPDAAGKEPPAGDVPVELGEDAPAADAAASPVITISDFTYSPQNLDVVPGQTVLVRNLDSVLHSVTSESAPRQFVPGPVNGVSFDTGPFMGEASFTIPATAPSGTVVPYYCSVHLGVMKNDAQITIE